MKLIIDGYNLLFADKRISGSLPGTKQLQSLHNNKSITWLEDARERVIALVENYNRSRKDEITIVFDGSANLRADSQRIKALLQNSGIKIIFSGDKGNADDLIIQLVQHEPNPRQVSVITSDNYIKDHTKPTGATIIDSVNFISKLGISSDDAKKSNTPAEPKQKLYGISPAEAEKWLELFGIEDEE